MSERQRAVFEAALRRERCPKCRGRVLETQLPDCVCEKCGTQFILATRIGGGFFKGALHAQLIEKNQPPISAEVVQPLMQQAANGRFCHGCGNSVTSGAMFCTKCGVQL